MAVATTPIASLPPILDPSPSPALNVADSLLYIEKNGQNALSVGIEGRWQNQKQRRLSALSKHKTPRMSLGIIPKNYKQYISAHIICLFFTIYCVIC